ncbi:MAG: hypothetical protein Q8Q26_10125 [Pseudorhodobacter sp.]|nr:hypothetical protein [Pseudorhodobacter sp.]
MSRFVEALRSEIADLERQLEANPIYMKLTEARRLLAVYVPDGLPQAGSPLSRLGVRTAQPAQHDRVRQFSGNSAAALDAAKQFIAGLGRPAKTTEVLEAISKVGIKFGGNAPQNTLSSIMSKSPDFVSKRGVGWVLNRENEKELAGGSEAREDSPPAIVEPHAEDREAGPGGGT